MLRRFHLVALLALLLALPLARSESAPNTIFAWNTAAPPPILRMEAQGAILDDKLYVFGGFYNDSYQATDRADVYDPLTNSWAQIADVPVPLTHAPVVVADGKLILGAGYEDDHPGPSTALVRTYDPATDGWSALPSLPSHRGAGGMVLMDRTLHFFGGATRFAGSDIAIDHPDHWTLDLDAPTQWITTTEIPLARNHLGAVAIDERFYAVGGQFGEFEQTTNQQAFDTFDPTTGQWEALAPLPEGRSHISASTLDLNGRVMIIGGSTNGGGNGFPSAAVMLYDEEQRAWIKLPELPESHKSPVAGVLSDGRVVVTAADKTWIGSFNNTWEYHPNMPIELGEVAAGIIGNRMYIVGESNPSTLVYNLTTSTWEPNATPRPFAGHHHAAEVVDGKWYLFGGIGAGAGQVQIFDPATNAWTLGTPMPFAAGSSSSALIDGQVYVAGGIVGNSTTTQVARYDPVANTWTPLAPMPQGRNHAATATDGTQMYVFGGRGPGSGDGNTVANGFNTLQIYDPATDTWRSSEDDPTLAPLPIGRGGMGKAVFLDGRFYVMGGETLNGPGAVSGNVYNRVDIYDVASNTWALGAPLPSPRHGIFPVTVGGRIYVAGGGYWAGQASAAAFEVYNPPWAYAPPPPAVQRINAGGPALITPDGTAWDADTYYSGGKSFAISDTIEIANTTSDAIYRSERSALSWGGSFAYEIPVAGPGTYRIRLHFAEIYWTAPGQRIFDVAIEGTTVLDDYDLFADAGALSAVIHEWTITIADSTINLDFSASVDQPKVAAIEIIPLEDEPTPTPPTTTPPTFTPTVMLPTITPTPSPTLTPTPTGTPAPATYRIFAPMVAR